MTNLAAFDAFIAKDRDTVTSKIDVSNESESEKVENLKTR